MDTHLATNAVTEEHLKVAEPDGFCKPELIEIVPVTTDTDGSCKPELIEVVPVTTYTDGSCKPELIEVVPGTTDTDGSCSAKHVVVSAEVKIENLMAVKDETNSVRCAICNVHFGFVTLC